MVSNVDKSTDFFTFNFLFFYFLLTINLLQNIWVIALFSSFVCCPIVDHVMLLLRIISFKLKQIHVEMNE